MKKIITPAALFFGATLLLSSCKPDDQKVEENQAALSIEKSKESVASIQDDIVSGISSMRKGQMMTSVKETAKLADGEMDTDFLDDVFTNFERDAFNVEELENNNRLVLNNYKGIYSYNKATTGWTKETHPSSLIIKFPCSETDTKNSLVFELSKYSDKIYTIDGEQLGVPIALNMTFKKNNDLLMSFIINSLVFKQDDQLIVPTTINASLYLNPFTTEITLTSENSGKTFDASIKLYDNEGFSTSITGNVTLKTNSYSVIEEDDIENIGLSLGVNNTTIKGSAEVGKLLKLDEPTQDQINALIDVTILDNNQKIADLYINNDKEIVELIYSDGSKEVIDEDYAQKFIEKIETELVNELGQID